MKRLALFFALVLTISSNAFVFGQSCPTTYNYETSGSNKTWSTETWAAAGGSVTTGGAPPAGWGPQSFTWSYNNQTYANSIVIPSGAVVDILDNSFDISPYTYIVVQGTLVANGKINIPSGGGIIIDTGGLVCCNGSCNASDRITLGGNGNPIWGGSTGNFTPVSGPTSCTGSCTTLPVILNSFKSHVNQSSVDITWSTASELNFDYFSLERSVDGKTFNEISQVKGHGTTNESHAYSFEDTDPVIGRSYYRLASNDFDGYKEIFKVISVEYNGEKRFHVSPNPSDGTSVKINFNFANEGDAQVTIYDNVGSVIGTYHVSGNGAVNFENPLKSGIYLAKYTSSSFTKTERFLVK